MELFAGLLLIPAVLLVRLLSVGIPFGVLERTAPFRIARQGKKTRAKPHVDAG